MLAKVAALIDGRRTVLDIVRGLRGCVPSQDVFQILYYLGDWGLIVSGERDPQTVICWQKPEAAESFRSLFEMCEPSLRFLVSINPDEDFPIFCYAAIPKQREDTSGEEAVSGNPGIYTIGAGFTRQAGISAALGEMTETLAANRSSGVGITRATIEEVGNRGLHPRPLLMFSDHQYENRDHWRHHYGARHRISIPVQQTVPLDWVTVTSYPEKEFCQVPAAYCYLNYPRDQDYLVADSNGCAAAPTRTEAIVSGFLELVERDAVAIWWYNRIRRSAIDLAIFNNTELNECVRWMDQHHRRFYTLDLTHDYGIPVIVAISVNNEDTDIAMGFGANFDYLTAIKSAVREMMQLYSLKRIMDRQIVSGGIESLDRSTRAFVSWAGSDFVKTHEHMRPHGMIRSLKAIGPETGPVDPEAAWQSCIALCRQKHQRLFVQNLTPSAADIAVVRVIAPGMRHFRARFGPGRLYQVPVDMGWRTVPICEENLTRIPVPI